MAASPNSATRSRSSSAASPDPIFDEHEPEPIDSIGYCTHISALLADPTESEPLLNRFRRVVTWKARRTHEALHSAKRRKVRRVVHLVYLWLVCSCLYR
jgi:ubiquitin carboxyl-terminal hydrolase 22/27/51